MSHELLFTFRLGQGNGDGSALVVVAAAPIASFPVVICCLTKRI